jgi:hypothetical protein
VGEVAVYAPLLSIGVERHLGRIRMLVTERDAIVDIIADRLHELPALRNQPEKAPRRIRQAIGLAVAATEQKDRTSAGRS